MTAEELSEQIWWDDLTHGKTSGVYLLSPEKLLEIVKKVQAEERTELDRLRTLEQRLIRLFHASPLPEHFDWTIVEKIEQGAALLARSEEREACAKVADSRADKAYARFEVLGHDHLGQDMIECCEGRAVAAAIRERGQSEPHVHDAPATPGAWDVPPEANALEDFGEVEAAQEEIRKRLEGQS
jgi:hypothetical protein